jgi:hypothetical protein
MAAAMLQLCHAASLIDGTVLGFIAVWHFAMYGSHAVLTVLTDGGGPGGSTCN